MHGQTHSARRAIVLVLDACGAGALPDADLYGDAGTNTLAHLASAIGGLRLPTLQRLGLGSIMPIEGVPPVPHPAVHGRLHALGPGKDSTVGHWELMGVVLERPQPSFPDGLPAALRRRLERAAGASFICGQPRNGIAAIEQFGAEHLYSRAVILYTSVDSVVQLAAHVDVVAEDELYEVARRVRAVLSGEHGVGRVIARPFTGGDGAFVRTPGRRDFALPPPSRGYIGELAQRGVPIHGVGKIADLFAGDPAIEPHPGAANREALASAAALLEHLHSGFAFVNLVETDQVYGHRKDVDGFHAALRAIDAEVERWLPRLRADDLLVLTADHGVDPAHPRTDHTREHVPLLAVTGEMLRRGGVASRDDAGRCGRDDAGRDDAGRCWLDD
ncbi:MAG: phosphopentomutase, partial [Solirubrobacteraceae bacterium]